MALNITSLEFTTPQPQALERLMKAVRKGEPDALLELAKNQHGLKLGLVDVDHREAFRTYFRASLMGAKDANIYLGLMIVLGQGGQRNEVGGIRIIRDAAKAGSGAAAYVMALVASKFAEQKGKEDDCARKWLALSACRKFARAETLLSHVKEHPELTIAQADREMSTMPAVPHFSFPETSTLGGTRQAAGRQPAVV